MQTTGQKVDVMIN